VTAGFAAAGHRAVIAGHGALQCNETDHMATSPPVETLSTGADKAKLAVAGVLVIAAVAAFYALGKQDLWLRVAVLLVVLAGAVATFFTSESGKELIAFGGDSVREVKKVVWPTRKEALQMTGYVFAFVFFMALFLWLTDKTLEWVLYDLILGWKH
jgi:preprotein translocase subunit SecE